MATSDAQVCNMALGKLGADPILTLAQDNENARACNRIYSEMRDAVIAVHAWNFAINRATLAQLSTAPASGYEYAYQLPTNPYCLRVLELKEERDSGYRYRIEGRTLVTDADSARIKYLMRVTDPQQFSSWFTQTLATRLAAELAYEITESRTKEADMWALYDAKLGEAEEMDAQEGHGTDDDEVIEEDGSWISVRG